MPSLWFGFASIIAVFFFSLAPGAWSGYLQFHSVLMVLGGTIAVLLFSTPVTVLVSLGTSLKRLTLADEKISTYQEELTGLAKNRQNAQNSAHPLTRYAGELWEQGIDPELFIVLLSQRRSELESRGMDAVQAFKNLSKYPPALGMTGTVMGMVSLFTALDKNRASIGTNLSMAMTATFLGLVLANAIISPIADRLQVKAVQEARVLDGIYEILLLLHRGEASTLIKDEVSDRAA